MPCQSQFATEEASGLVWGLEKKEEWVKVSGSVSVSVCWVQRLSVERAA